MSYKITTPIWESAPYGGTRLLVLLAMADTAGHDGSFFISQTDLARQARCSIEYVRQSVAQFVADGILIVVRKGVAKGRATDYRIVIPPPNRVGESPRADSPTLPTDSPTLAGQLPHFARGQQSYPTERTDPSPRRSAPDGVRTRDLPLVEDDRLPRNGPAIVGDFTTLPGMPQEQPPRTAGDLVAAWVDGYTQARGTPPLSSQVQRMAGSAKRLAPDLTDDAAWDAGLHLAERAGRDSFYDLVLAIPKYHSVQVTDAWWVKLPNSGRGIGS